MIWVLGYLLVGTVLGSLVYAVMDGKTFRPLEFAMIASLIWPVLILGTIILIVGDAMKGVIHD